MNPNVRATKLGQIARWFAAIFLLAMTPVLGVVGWKTYQSAKVTETWPTATGVMTRVQLRDAGVRGGYRRYEPDVAYVYQVNGQRFEGTKVRRQDPYLREWQAKDWLKGLAVGQRRDVYYNPADPSDALLVPGAISGEAWLIPLPIVPLIGGMAILIWLIRTRGTRPWVRVPRRITGVR